MTQDWFAIEEAEGAATGWRFGAAPHMAKGDSAAEVAQLLAAQTPVIIGEAAIADQMTPAAILPPGLPMPGIAQASPADRLPPAARLRALGFTHLNPDWDGVICLCLGPATHWLQISANELISLHSTLTPKLARDAGATGATGAPDEAAMAEALSRPEKLAGLLHRAYLQSDPAAAFGALLGAELAATRPYWLGQQLALIAPAPLAQPYEIALNSQFIPFVALPPEEAARAGFMALQKAGFAGTG